MYANKHTKFLPLCDKIRLCNIPRIKRLCAANNFPNNRKEKYAMKQCTNGHIYDELLHVSCPYCNSSGNIGARPLNNEAAQPMYPGAEPFNAPMAAASPTFPKTEPLNAPVAAPAPAPAPMSAPAIKKEMGVTVALNVSDSGINPTRGWLVVVNGDKMGLSFVVHSEKNTIGRGEEFDINLSFDRAVSKDGNAVVAYDARNRKFFVSPSVGKNNVYHNDQLLLMPTELKDFDAIEVGATKLVFRSFCCESFTY